MYKQKKAQGHVFVFKYDSVDPSVPHIFARHLKHEDDAIDIFFRGRTTFDGTRACFITVLGNEERRWFWKDEAKKIVIVITCFDRD